MATPIHFPQANTVWKGWEADDQREAVGDLQAYRDESTNRTTSCWALSLAELAEVQRTGKVWLQVVGQHPPVYVGGADPFKATE